MANDRGPMAWAMARVHAPIYASRLRELVRQIVPELREGDRVLDVGCGNGTLGRAIMEDAGRPRGVSVRGLERARRGGEPIEVVEYDGVKIPLPDRSEDVVIVADVLHHEREPERLLRECARVSRRLVIVKDHRIAGILARQRISLIDWAANAPYGVPCLYRYNTAAEWASLRERVGLGVVREMGSMKLYPPVVNFLFGRKLQYLAVLKAREERRGVNEEN